MAHVIPTLRTTLHTTYTPSQARLKSASPANTVAPAKATDFRTLFRSQSNALRTAASNRWSSAYSPANRPQMFSGSFVRNQESRARAIIPAAGAEGTTSSVGSSASQAQAPQATTPTTADTTPDRRPHLSSSTEPTFPPRIPLGRTRTRATLPRTSLPTTVPAKCSAVIGRLSLSHSANRPDSGSTLRRDRSRTEAPDPVNRLHAQSADLHGPSPQRYRNQSWNHLAFLRYAIRHARPSCSNWFRTS